MDSQMLLLATPGFSPNYHDGDHIDVNKFDCDDLYCEIAYSTSKIMPMTKRMTRMMPI